MKEKLPLIMEPYAFLIPVMGMSPESDINVSLSNKTWLPFLYTSDAAKSAQKEEIMNLR